MGHCNAGNARFPDIRTELGSHPLLGDCIKSADRLVEEEEGRVDDKGPGKGRPLPLTPGELSGADTGEAFEGKQRKVLLDTGPDLWGRDLSPPQAESHVFIDGHVRKNGAVLEDNPDIPLFRGDVNSPRAIVEDSVTE